MKRFSWALLMLSLIVFGWQANADDLFDEIESKADSVIGFYATPVVEAFGTGVGGGLYHTAATHGVLGFDVGARVMIVTIPSGKSELLDSADVTAFPIPVIQAAVGLPMDFEVMLRGFSVKVEDETISLYGAGVKKNFASMIPVPMFPDVSAMLAYHKFKGADVLSASVVSFDVMVSKKLSLLIFSVTPSAGLGFDNTKMNFKYDYVDESIDKDFTGKTTRFTLGLDISPFPFVHLFGNYNFTKFPQATAGLVISFR